jgi:predicted DNA-binding transcriptional regulator YafY
VATTPGGAHVWRVKPSERGRTVALRRAQAYGLLAARKVFDVMKGSALYDELDVVVRQLTQVAQRPGRAPGEISAGLHLEDRFLYCPNAAKSYASRAEELDDLFQSVAELRAVRFRHRAPTPKSSGGGGESDSRETRARVTLRPYALLLHGGSIFCVGHDVERNAVRAFAFEAMVDLAPLGIERFELPADFDANDYVHGDFGVATRSAKPTRILVEFDPSAADRVRARRVHPSQKVATAPDGRIRVSLAVPSKLVPHVKSWILGFGATARVIEPRELAIDVMGELRRSLDAYGPG